MSKKTISEINKDDGIIEIVAMIEKVIQGVASNGNSYLTILICDKTGNIDARLWEVNDKDLLELTKGKIINFNCTVSEYRKVLQLKINNYQVADQNEFDIDDFIESAPIDPEKEYQFILSVINEFKNENYKTIMLQAMKKYGDKFKTWPAAVRNHHNVQYGLLWHSLTMLKQAISLKAIYFDRDIDWELLYAGVILHDMGKVKELSSSFISEYTIEGNLVGHISIMSQEIYRIANELNLLNIDVIKLQHMVLASHGRLEYGSSVVPHLLEAEILSFIDNLDARIYRVDREIRNLEVGKESVRIAAVEQRSFYKHKK